MRILRTSKILLILVILTSNLSSAQTDSVSSKQDSTKNFSEFKLKFNNNSFAISPLFVMKQEMFFEEYSQFIFPTFEEKKITVPVEMMQLRNEMNQTMQLYRQGTLSTDLGFVGKVLGYAAGAAAVGLGAYHVYKYKDKYNIK
ncbi:MAG: hypothetical protein KDC90_16590 [Ignavibacteriae bacterium]|nr:hypothetical protein [Ignavibacteriota bacterium]